MNRLQKINKIIEYTKLYEKDKSYYKDAIKQVYYKHYTNNNLNFILNEYDCRG